MRHLLPRRFDPLRRREHAGALPIVLVVVFFLLGLALGALWHRTPAKTRPAPAQESNVELSEPTKAVLTHVDGPIEIRFYSLLDPGSPAGLREFSGRVDRLLSSYETQAQGKLVIKRLGAQQSTSPSAATADGISGFDLDQGTGCFLGLVLSGNGRKEVLARLAPEWEPALEADLSRAIGRVAQAGIPAPVRVPTPATDTAVDDEVKRIVPNYASIGLDEGARTLHEAALKELGSVVNQMQAEVQDARLRLDQAQTSGSAAEQDSAMKHLQEVQAAQAERLKMIAAKSQAQVAALQRLKAGSTP